jgi:pimeloyl-ACP methyl ester carboxylesterase
MPNIRITGRDVLMAGLAVGAAPTDGTKGATRSVESYHNANVAYGQNVLPPGIRSRLIDNGNGLVMHVLEAGFDGEDRPCVVLLHGFPELAFSWRKVIPTLAAAGYHVVAPDQRGYGRTTGWDGSYDGDVGSFRLTNLARDVIGLVAALGYRSVAAVVGHDFGSPVAAWCALLRPDVFRSVVLLSAPFAGPPELPFNTVRDPRHGPMVLSRPLGAIQADLAALNPPRKHYQWYYSTREANDNMQHAPQGVHEFLRAYYHVKSADWPQNRPFRLQSWTAAELAKLPRYYIMDLDKGMAETVAADAPTAAKVAACKWLPEDELRVYSEEFARNGFLGGLQWYRCGTNPKFQPELETYSGRTIDGPSCFIGGRSDWGVYQSPGALQAMAATACTDFRGVHLVDGAGHWVQQEQYEAVSTILTEFLHQQV